MHIVNSRPVVWFLNEEYEDISKSHFHQVLTSPLACGTDGKKRYVLPDFRKGQVLYTKAKEWLLQNIQTFGDSFTPEQRDMFIKEAERKPAKLIHGIPDEPLRGV